MSLSNTEYSIDEFNSKICYYKFNCNQFNKYINTHYVPNIVHLHMPRISNYCFTEFLLVHGIEHEEDFQIYSYFSFGSFKKIFELSNFKARKIVIEDDYNYKDLMFKNYPIQTVMSPFLIANFETRTYESKLLENEEEERGQSKIYHFHNRFDVIANSGFVENTFNSKTKLHDNFICDIIFKLDYSSSIILRINFKNKDRKNENFKFLFSESDTSKEELIATYKPFYLKKGNLIWRQNHELPIEYKGFKYPTTTRMAPYSEEIYLEDDDDSYINKSNNS